MRIRRAFIKFPCLHGSMHLVTTTSPCPFSPSLRASVATRNQEIVPPSHHHTLPPGIPYNRATCHTHAATVPPWDLVCHRDTTMPPCNLVRHCSRAAVPPPYWHNTSVYLRTPTHLTAVNHTTYLCTSWYCLIHFHNIVCC